MPRAFRLWAVLAAVLSVQALPARAQLSGKPFEEGLRAPDSLLDGAAHDRHTQISAYGVFGFGLGFGVAARYSYPLFKDGFIPELNDSFEIEGGGEFVFGTFAGLPSVAAGLIEPRWTFHFSPQFDAYAKLGVGFFYWFRATTIAPVQLLVSAGALYKLSTNFWLRGEVGSFGTLLGVGLDF